MTGITEQLRGEARGKAVRDRLDDQVGIWGAPFPVARGTLVDDLKVITVACAPNTMKGLNVRSAAAEAVGFLVDAGTVVKAVLEIVRPAAKDTPPRAGRDAVSRFEPTSFKRGVIGTHVPKATDATVEMSVVSDIGPTRDGEIPFLSGAIPTARRRFGSATTNPAGDAKKIRFLGLSVEFEGRVMAMAEWMGEGRDFVDALEAAGWPRVWLDATARSVAAAMDGLGSVDSVPPGLKTIHFPLPGGGYVMLSPLTSAAQWSETHARIRRIPAPGQAREAGTHVRSYLTARRKVGGSNPQNISFETPMLGSGYDLLKSMPPDIRMPPNLSRILHRVATTGSAIGDARLPTRLGHLLDGHVAPDARRNARWSARLARLLASAASRHLAGPLALATAVEAGLDPRSVAGISDAAERALVLHGFESLSNEAVSALVTGFADYLSAPPSGVAWLAGDHVRGDLRAAIEAAARGETAQDAEEDGEAPTPPVARAPAHVRAAAVARG